MLISGDWHYYFQCSEEQDFEYARRIQEEMQRQAEEAQRREEEDEVGQSSFT